MKTEQLLEHFFRINAPGCVTFDGTTITHACKETVGDALPVIMQFQFFIDDSGLHMRGSLSPDVTDIEEREQHVATIAMAVDGNCSGCAFNGTDDCNESFNDLTFNDGKVEFPQMTLRLNPDIDMEDALCLCSEFEMAALDTMCNVFEFITPCMDILVIGAPDDSE